MRLRETAGHIILLLLLVMAAGCSTSRNTATSRAYQALVTRYNVYFNGNEAYKKGYEAQEIAKQDNLLEILDLFPISDPNVLKTGTSDFDLAIEKAQKSIKLHSISAKPKKKKGTMSEAEKQWQNKNEYNPFMWHAWFLMADAQRQKGDFIEASSTYSYISKLFFDEPEIVAEAQYKMAQCYSEMGWNYESEELFQRSGQTKTGMARHLDYQARLASHLLKQERYEESIAPLEEAINRKGVSKRQRIREKYLLAQLYKTTGRSSDAYRMFGKVIRMSPEYDIELQARIQQTETMAQNGNVRKIMKKLKRMERNPNNKEHLDQIYYAMGNIHLMRGDTVAALQLYNTGASNSEKASPEKGILLLTMANLYWNMTEYALASECYSKAVGMIGTTHKEYETVKLRSEVLEDLVRCTETIKLQDSLQWLSTLPEDKLFPIIDRIIEEYKEQEKLEEEKLRKEAKDEARKEAAAQKSISTDDKSTESGWYFYNAKAVERGKKDFRKQWGDRKLEDDWRRSNKTMLAMPQDAAEPSLAAADGLLTDSLSAISDSIIVTQLETDPYKREYYIQNIPYSDEEKEKSNKLISEALLQQGIIYKDRLSEYPDAEKSLTRIVTDYPESDEADKAMYNLYLMYSLWGKHSLADSCRARMQRLYPKSDYTVMVCDPDYIDNARYGKHREDSIYAETYAAYREGNTLLVRKNCDISANKYPKGQHRAKFMFLDAVLDLQNGHTDSFLEKLKEIVAKYPQDEISQFAGLIAQGIQNGKILQSSSFGSIWDRRNGTAGSTDSDSDSIPQFSDDRYQPFLFVLAYPDGELDRNQLLFEVARYNFTNYMIRNFDMEFQTEQGIGMLKVGEFLNFDEAYVYSRSLYEDADMAQKLSGIKALVISPQNLRLLLLYYTFNEYQEFYEEHFLNIPEFDIDGATLFEEYTDDGE